MTAVQRFKAEAPKLIAAAAAQDPQISVYVRQALAGVEHWDLPIGVKVESELGPAWVAAVRYKLMSPNFMMRDWRLRSAARKTWNRILKDVVARAEGFASFSGLELHKRAPNCRTKMTIQVVRLVPSVREFLRDEENDSFCTKQFSDALNDVHLIREDRREWLKTTPLIQDVSPIADTPITLFILQPVDVHGGFLTGAPDAIHRPESADARRQVPTDHRRAEEGRAVSGLRRRAGPRAVDV